MAVQDTSAASRCVESSSKLQKVDFNNFIVQFRPKIKAAVVSAINKLTHLLSKTEKKESKKASLKCKQNDKAENYFQQIQALKSIHDHDIAKFIVLFKKTFKEVADDPNSSAEERALSRIAKNKKVQTVLSEFRMNYPNWAEEVPSIIKTLGVNYRKERLKRLKEKGELKEFIAREKKTLLLMHKIVGLDVDASLLQGNPTSLKTEAKLKKPKSGKGNKEERKTKNKGIESLENSVDKKKKGAESPDNSNVVNNGCVAKESEDEMVNEGSFFKNGVEDSGSDDGEASEFNDNDNDDDNIHSSMHDTDKDLSCKEGSFQKKVGKKTLPEKERKLNESLREEIEELADEKTVKPERESKKAAFNKKLLKLLKNARQTQPQPGLKPRLNQRGGKTLKKTSEIKQVDLSLVDKIDFNHDESDDNESEDENLISQQNFSESQNNGVDHSYQNGIDDDDDYGKSKRETVAGKRKKSLDSEGSDENNYETSEFGSSKYFKRNMYREYGDGRGRAGLGKRGGSRGRGDESRFGGGRGYGYRGRGRGFDDRRGYNKNDRGRNRRFLDSNKDVEVDDDVIGGRMFGGRGFVNGKDDKDGDDDRGGGGGRGFDNARFMDSDKNVEYRDKDSDREYNGSTDGSRGRDFGDRGRGRGFGDRGRGRGFGDRGRGRDFGDRGRGRGFGDRGRGRGFGDRGRGRDFGDRGRGRGFGDRGRRFGQRGRGFGDRNRRHEGRGGRPGRDHDISSSNHVPLGERKPVNQTGKKETLLHPSWLAKQKEVHTAAVKSQGKRVVFD